MLSWHRDALLQTLARRQRLAHALLVQGDSGIGVVEFASTLARALLCESPAVGGLPCGQCVACNWFTQGNHPDFRLVQPESYAPEDPDAEAPVAKGKAKSEQIRIDQVRELAGFLGVGTHRAGNRVVVLYPADTMNEPTQNALLKSLEEPPPATVFLLVTSHPDRLLPTVRSRCQAILLPRPAPADALAWLKEQKVEAPERILALAGGAPLLAAELAEREQFLRLFTDKLSDRRMDPLALAQSSEQAPATEFVAALYRWCYDLLALKLAGRARYHAASETALRDIASRCEAVALAGFLRTLAEARELATHPLNPRLFFEDLLLRYQVLTAGKTK